MSGPQAGPYMISDEAEMTPSTAGLTPTPHNTQRQKPLLRKEHEHLCQVQPLHFMVKSVAETTE